MTEAGTNPNVVPNTDQPERGSPRPILLMGLVLLCFLVGYTFCGPLLPDRAKAGRATQLSTGSRPPAAPDDLRMPDKSMSPEQVVALQMESLKACRDNRGAIHQVFAFASPANQSMTGPIDRFERMVWVPPYDAMITNDYWMSGRAIEREGLATVLVTTVDAQGGISLFRFFLSRQSDLYPGCWMTDRVHCLYQHGSGSAGAGHADSSEDIGI